MNRTLLSLALAAAMIVPATAQDYPSRPISIVVPYPAGGVTDGLIRLLAEHMKGSLGQTVVVENVGGAAGTIGVSRAARAAADGYTIVLANSETLVLAP